MIRFVHIIDPKNTGDLMSGAYHWFDLQQFPALNYSDPVPDDGAATVYGGGTMVNWLNSVGLDELPSGPKVIWGAGSSRHGETEPWPDPDGFALIGTREWSAEREGAGLWAPCASCMSPQLDDPSPAWREAVAFVNASESIRSRYPAVYGLELPMLANDAPFDAIVEFLASAEVVVTNSYHGVVWGTLLGRRVVCIGYSSKFHGFKHPPALSTGSDWRGAARSAETYPDALEDCRSATRRFYERVMELA